MYYTLLFKLKSNSTLKYDIKHKTININTSYNQKEIQWDLNRQFQRCRHESVESNEMRHKVTLCLLNGKKWKYLLSFSKAVGSKNILGQSYIAKAITYLFQFVILFQSLGNKGQAWKEVYERILVIAITVTNSHLISKSYLLPGMERSLSHIKYKSRWQYDLNQNINSCYFVQSCFFLTQLNFNINLFIVTYIINLFNDFYI